MGEEMTEGGAQEYTQRSDDPTTREGGDTTGMEEKHEEQETEARGSAGAHGRQRAEKGEVPEGTEGPGAPAQEWHSHTEGAGAHKAVSGSGEEREAGGQLENKRETSSERQGVGEARGEQDEQVRGEQDEQAKAAEAAAVEARQQ
jgi:hypothetical protein